MLVTGANKLGTRPADRMTWWVPRVAALHAWGRGFPKSVLQVQIRQRTWSYSGRAFKFQSRVIISCHPSDDAVNLMVLLHEFAHIATPGANHDQRWRDTFMLATRELTGDLPAPKTRNCYGDDGLDGAVIACLRPFLARLTPT